MIPIGAVMRETWQRSCAKILIALALAGCGGGQPAVLQGSVQAAEDETVFVSPALDATVRQFLGDGAAASVPGGGGVLGDLGGDTLSPDSDTPYSVARRQRQQIAVELHQPMAGRLSAVTVIALGQGHSRYVLPEGSGILDDPITIAFRTNYATMESGLSWTGTVMPQIGYDLGVGAGVRLTHTRTQIASALLDVHNSSHQRDPYVVLRAGIRMQPDPESRLTIHADAEARAYPGQAASIGAGISARY